MFKFPKLLTLLAPAFMFPHIALAAPRTFAELVNRLVTIIDLIIPALVTAAIVLFLYNILGSFGFLSGDDNAVSREKFRTAALWGIAIIFFIVSIWGILRILQDTLFSSSSFSASGFDAQVNCDEFDNCSFE